ncbi:formin-like protein 3 [Panicum virgatum]|uniref:formin-like protein 3 n=1 Tax=Panicum virgatum TaxID=38727 RepID=UPI0019D5A48D|nr:formin-like protein 3 [Panicum virgatum]
MWPGSSSGGPGGPPPRPGPPPSPQHALMAGAPSAFYAPPPAPGAFYQAPPPAPSPWDPHSLANAFSTVSLTPPPSSSDWVIDSGASSHIASNSGSPHQDPSSSM